MARTSLSTEADEAPQTPPPQTPAPPPPPPQPPLLSMARIAIIMRMITLVFLVLSVSLLASNSTTIRVGDSTTTVHFNDIYAYRYALATGVIGLSYTFMHLISSLQQVRSGMLLNDPKFLLYEFIGDKVILALVATGVGAAFGATVELKAKMDDLENAYELYLGITVFAPIVSKFDDFFNRAYIPTIFLLLAFLSTGLSSILSSLALTNKTT
ncbi:CASP-like protein 4D1 [Salvia hispanica]|uniref:CASP-like protein 4D1 n=1 Tax=Salvia hispanica TaxID=49212 RepID=UPI0020099F04|nr:CASP-like protein 4D1 [Salvia hispanica]